MPKIDKMCYKQTEVYRANKNHEAFAGDNNFCAPLAVAIATGVSPDKVAKLFEQMGRKKKRGTQLSITREVIKALGFKTRLIDPNRFITKYPGKHRKNIKNVTTHHPDRFRSVWADGKTYLLGTTKHILCVKDGLTHDWMRGSSKYVITIEEVYV